MLLAPLEPELGASLVVCGFCGVEGAAAAVVGSVDAPSTLPSAAAFSELPSPVPSSAFLVAFFALLGFFF